MIVEDNQISTKKRLIQISRLALAVFLVILAVFICLTGTPFRFDVKRYIGALVLILPLFIFLDRELENKTTQASSTPQAQSPPLQSVLDLPSEDITSAEKPGKSASGILPTTDAHYTKELITRTPSPMYMKDKNGTYLLANSVFCTLAGKSLDLIEGKTDFDIFPLEVANLFRWQDQQVADENRMIEYEESILLLDELHTYITVKFPIHDEDGNIYAVGGHCTDVTERKKALLALTDSEHLYNTTMDSAIVGIYIIQDNTFVYVNSASAGYFGYTPEEVIGRLSPFDVTAPEEEAKVKDRLEKLADGLPVKPYEIKCKRKDGSIFHSMIWDNPITYKGKIASVGTIIDITEKKLLETELLKAEHLDAIGTLAGGIAHDYNNILSAILGNVKLARRFAAIDSQIDSILSDAERATNRASQLTNQLLTFAKGGAPVKEVASLADLIRETARFLLHGSQSLDLNIAEDLWLTEVDTGQTSQVIQNLIINAQQAMSPADSIEISCDNVPAALKTEPELKPGDYVRMIIKDTGRGIPAANLKNVFDPYFSTKENGHGLGLATSYSIVKRHGGIISVESEENVGTTFTIYLPATRKKIPKREVAHTVKDNYTGTILIMDDNEMIRDVAYHTLTHLGFNVLLSASGEEAIAIFRDMKNENTPVDLTIMDLTIPGAMGGKEAMTEFLKIDQNAKVIVVSGYANAPIVTNYKEYGFSAAATKPIDFLGLADEIDRLITSDKSLTRKV